LKDHTTRGGGTKREKKERSRVLYLSTRHDGLREKSLDNNLWGHLGKLPLEASLVFRESLELKNLAQKGRKNSTEVGFPKENKRQ